MAEKVIVIGVDKEGTSFASCITYKDDEQVENEVYSRFKCDDFLIFYTENIDVLEDVLEDFYIKTSPKKLEPPDVRTIKDMVKSKVFNKKEIAKNFGVSIKTIDTICKGKRYVGKV